MIVALAIAGYVLGMVVTAIVITLAGGDEVARTMGPLLWPVALPSRCRGG